MQFSTRNHPQISMLKIKEFVGTVPKRDDRALETYIIIMVMVKPIYSNKSIMYMILWLGRYTII